MKKLTKNVLMLLLIFLLGLNTACNSTDQRSEENEIGSREVIDQENNEPKDPYISKLESIASQIVKAEGKSVQKILNQAYAVHGNLVENIYYADAKGKMVLSPSLLLPDDYDARQRLWYKKALKEKLYKPRPFQDASIEKNIQTIAKALYVDDELVGVIGMDYELENNHEIEDLNSETNLNEKQKEKLLLSIEEKERLKAYVKELSQVVETEGNLEILKKYFDEQIEKGVNGVETIYLANKNEIFIVSPYVQLPENYDPSVRHWYKLAMQESLYISDVFIDVESKETIVTVSTKIELENESLAVLGLDFIIDL